MKTLILSLLVAIAGPARAGITAVSLPASAPSAAPAHAVVETVEQDPQLAARWASMRSDFAVLAAAAGFKPGELPFVLTLSTNDNAAFVYDGESAPYVEVDRGMLPKPRMAHVWVLSHELGHAIQYRLGYFTAKANYGKPFAAYQTEAHADYLGLILSIRAGFAAKDWIRGFAIDWTPEGAADPTLSDDHPATKDRMVNLWSLYARAVSITRGLEGSAARSTEEYRDYGTPNLFREEDGATARSRPVTPDEVQKRCEVIVDGRRCPYGR